MSSNPDSILDSVKKVIGFDSEYTAFDLDITMFINGAFGSLRQLGVGSDTGFVIADNTTLWSQYTTQLAYLALIKAFICMSTRLAFDPPATSFGIDAVKSQIQELTWRINVAAESIDPPSDPFADPGYSGDAMSGGVLKTYFAPKVVQLQYTPVVTPDASAGNMFYLTLTGDCTINAPVNGSDGEHVTLEITSNGHAAAWGSGWDFGDAGAPALSATKADIVSAYYKEAAASWRAGFTTGF